MLRVFQKLRFLLRVELWQTVQQHLQNFQLVVQKPRRVIAVISVAGKETVDHAIQPLFKVVQEEGKIRKIFAMDGFTYVFIQFHLRRFRVKLKDVLDFAHGQIVGVIERHFFRIACQIPCPARKLRHLLVTIILHFRTSFRCGF